MPVVFTPDMLAPFVGVRLAAVVALAGVLLAAPRDESAFFTTSFTSLWKRFETGGLFALRFLYSPLRVKSIGAAMILAFFRSQSVCC